MSLYFSTRQNQLVAIKDMNTQHILNALKKVRAGKHPVYNPLRENTDQILVDLLTELESRNAQRMHELETKIARLSFAKDLLEKRIRTENDENRSVARTTLEDMRRVAERLIATKGHVTADTLRLELQKTWPYVTFNNFHSLAHVFKGKQFKKIGFLQSRIPSNHGRFISVWGSAANL